VGGGGQEEASWRTRLVEQVVPDAAFVVWGSDFEGDDLAASAPCSSSLLGPPSSKAGIAVEESCASPAEEEGAKARRGVDVRFQNEENRK
jgi:hypothetical protein